MNKRNSSKFGIIVVLSGLILGIVAPVLACGGGEPMTGFDDAAAPKAIVMAAFGSLSQQLGMKLSPDTTPWQWQEDVFANSYLECPRPGQTPDKTLTRGYRILISVWDAKTNTSTDYFFNATKDGSLLFQCAHGQPGTTIAVNPNV